ncbi:sigma 54-interacting transcriptional regulator [Clostridium sp. DJ247]|uniref:sigma 54-interacting transcriptional regulator n=1 Tax=Clostridium sp. DJ247 TaxID=2726188 RepID=UPI00162AA73E|nr:sigma 54-interacting transcriptional regulator [Clostridium sp. DJ247]MBC2580520.1 sigma 54-interacting transcriptional regulator [Clostridium sp. DJ247]
MEEILLVAPYDKLEQLAKKLKKSVNVPFSVLTSNLDQGINKIEKKIKGGVKVIVTRGGTARYLRKKLDTPIIEIPVTSFDILKAISSISNKGYKRIAFVTTSNIIFKKDYFNKILDVTLDFEACNEVSEIAGKVKYLISDKKVDAIVGDVIATREAIKNGIYGELLESGEESIVQAIIQANEIIKLNLEERVRAKKFETILNMVREGIITVDTHDNLTVYNSAVEKILGYSKDSVIGKNINECLPEGIVNKLSEKMKEENMLTDLNGKKVVFNKVPICIDDKLCDTVIFLDETTNIEKLELKIRKNLNEKGFVAKNNFSNIIGESHEIVKMKNQAIKFAKSEGTILIHGETGTGKELFAQSIHNESKRVNMPFVSVNCAALSANLLESELFGYEEGAFTGAVRGGKKGLFELSHGGTLFLDEIGEISLGFQSKLLRVLQEKEIRRIGGDKVIPINVRIICATNRNLLEEVEKGNFREDLYYRLSALELDLIPIRLRKKDIVPMVISFLQEECIRENKKLYWNNNNIFNCLLDYDWYGNARELRNLIERLVACCDGQELNEEFIMETLNSKKKKKISKSEKDNKNEINIRLSNNLKEMESEILKILLNRCNGDKDKLCKDFCISKTTLWRKLNFNNEK